MADEKPDEIPEIPEPKELPSPRFGLLSRIFDEIDQTLAKYDGTDQLTIFEFEIVALMIRKKIEHLGIIAALNPHDEESHQINTEIYNIKDYNNEWNKS